MLPIDDEWVWGEKCMNRLREVWWMVSVSGSMDKVRGADERIVCG